MSQSFFKHRIVFSRGKRRPFLVFVAVFALVFIGTVSAGFLSPAVRLGLHRVAVLTGLFPDRENVLFPVRENVFTDVPVGHPQFLALAELKKKGFIKGYGDGSFQPEKKINRAEAVELLVALKGIEPNRVNFAYCFKDIGQEWFAGSICYAKNKQWVSGYSDGMFRPYVNVTQVEAQKILSTTIGDPALAVSIADTEKDGPVTRAEFAGWIYAVLAGNL